MKPSKDQIANRHWRDKNKNYLLQRELAILIPCSVSCVRDCEKEGRWPLQNAVRQNAVALYRSVFGKDAKIK